MKSQRVVLWVSVADDASDPDVVVSDVLQDHFAAAGKDYTVSLLESGEVQND